MAFLIFFEGGRGADIVYFEEILAEGSLVSRGKGLVGEWRVQFVYFGDPCYGFAVLRERGSCLDLSYTGSEVFLC